jgi:tetratricopeptide (TPR) repeat protein
VVYNSQSFARRRELHAQVAAYLEAALGDEDQSAVAEQAELLAHHYERSDYPLPAARYLLHSGHKARQRFAYDQAGEYYSRTMAALDRLVAGELTAEVLDLRSRAYEGQGDVALLCGKLGNAAHAYGAARACLAEGEVSSALLLKLALVLPTQGQADEAEAHARRAWAMSQEERAGTADGLAASATLAWLHWRAGDEDAEDWIERGKALATGGNDRWVMGVCAQLIDLAGDWAEATKGYLELDRLAGAALAACRQGDTHLHQGDGTRALAFYDQAAELWEQESDAAGLALACYRQAEVLSLQEDPAEAGELLCQASDLLEQAPSADEEDRQVIQQALNVLRAERSGPWPPWRWQCYDDAFRISVLFRP